MQTFLPFASFIQSAKALDWRRLGKQRVEARQILNTLTGSSSGWANHPAVRMWRGHERSLCDYAIAVCTEWRERGYRDSLLPQFQQLRDALPDTGTPEFVGDAEFHASHRSNLLRKAPDHYRPLGWDEAPDQPYVWPE